MPPPPPPGFQPQGAPAGGGIRRRWGKVLLIRIGVLAVVAVVVVVAGLWFNRDEPTNAKVGDCLAGKTGDTLKIAKCGDAKATFKIVGKINSVLQSEVSGNPQICQAYPTAQNTFWQGEQGKKGYALCLEPIEK